MIYLPNEQETSKEMDRIMIRTTMVNERQSSNASKQRGAGSGGAIN
jgi:hypothetical protein